MELPVMMKTCALLEIIALLEFALETLPLYAHLLINATMLEFATLKLETALTLHLPMKHSVTTKTNAPL
jgi:hypothetical protein